MDEPMLHETSESELRRIWKERDDLYADRLLPLSDAEVAAVRKARRNEASYIIPPERRANVYRSALRWHPPVLGEVS